MKKPVGIFIPFYFEGNERWGHMNTPEDVKDLLNYYPYEELRKAQGLKNSIKLTGKPSFVGKPSFGFYAEYNDKYTLGQFIDDNNMEEFFK